MLHISISLKYFGNRRLHIFFLGINQHGVTLPHLLSDYLYFHFLKKCFTQNCGMHLIRLTPLYRSFEIMYTYAIYRNVVFSVTFFDDFYVQSILFFPLIVPNGYFALLCQDFAKSGREKCIVFSSTYKSYFYLKTTFLLPRGELSILLVITNSYFIISRAGL